MPGLQHPVGAGDLRYPSQQVVGILFPMGLFSQPVVFIGKYQAGQAAVPVVEPTDDAAVFLGPADLLVQQVVFYPHGVPQVVRHFRQVAALVTWVSTVRRSASSYCLRISPP